MILMEDDIRTLSLGSVVGGTSPSTRRWEEGITSLAGRVVDARAGVSSPINVNVVFHVPGHLMKPEFEGARSGRFSRSDSWLMVQVALPEEPPADVDAYLMQALVGAVDEAERWARKRKRVDDLTAVRSLVSTL